MKKTLVLVTDLGGFKAYNLENNQPISSPRLELLEEYKDAEAHQRLVEQVSDLSGRFPRRTGARAAGRLDSLMQNPEIEQCFLAASREIMNPLLQELSAGARSKIGINIPVDLMKASKVELLRQFRV